MTQLQGVKQSRLNPRTPPASPSRRSPKFRRASPNRPVGAKSRQWRHDLSQLHVALDKLYLTCERDEKRLECEEVIAVVKTALADFEDLIERFLLQAEFELAEEGDKPLSLSWYVSYLLIFSDV